MSTFAYKNVHVLNCHEAQDLLKERKPGKYVLSTDILLEAKYLVVYTFFSC